MSQLKRIETPIADLNVIERQKVGDERGFLSRIFCLEELEECGWKKPIAQVNHTYTARRGTVRGFHFQLPPFAEIKLVTCLKGEVWDVAIDLRQGSPTYLKSYGVSLCADNQRALLIPEGFAHGFQSISDDVELLYCHSQIYTPSAERGINPEDPILEVKWPLEITVLSERDSSHPMINHEFEGVAL